jgi:glycosyltransferase involved in cell wall biosynthesis
MANTFECLGVDIERIDCLPKSSKIVTKVYRIIQKVTKSYLYDERSFFTIWKTSKAAQLRIQNSDADLILTMQYPPISFLKTRKPIVFWNDSLFGNLLGYYDTMPVPPKWHLDEIYKLEKKAIEKSSAIVMCSAWARDNACKMYGVDPRKMHVIPYGANLSKSYNFPTNRILAYNETIHLLSVGYEWKRKGMDLSCQLGD